MIKKTINGKRKQVWNSASRLDKKIEKIEKQIASITTEKTEPVKIRPTSNHVKGTAYKNKKRLSQNKWIIIAIWAAIAILLLSVAIISIKEHGTNTGQKLTGNTHDNRQDSGQGNQQESRQENDEKVTLQEKSSIPTEQKEPAYELPAYYGVVLTGLAPLKYEYHTDEEAEIEATIEQNKTKETEMKINYQLTDQKGKTIYNYTDKITIKQKKNTLRKKILLTENYKTGKYTIKFKATFKQKNKQYALLGKTGFNIIKKPKKPLKARPEKTTTQLSTTHEILLGIILLLNILLSYNTWKTKR